MALPPITNTPVPKVVSAQDKPASKKSGVNATASSTQDTVTLSAEALKLLDENKIQSDSQARQVAADVGNALAQDQDLSLVKDSSSL
jgi:hypothetical protein